MRNAPYALAALFAVCGGAIAIGDVERDVNLDAVRELWADVLRDADRAGMKAVRVGESTEIRMGRRLANRMSQSWYEDPAAGGYVSAVGRALAPHVRRTGIGYRFHVVHSAEVNAFALPGGDVYVTRATLDFLESEAELAAILGHEMAHVDARHAIGRYQYEAAAGGAGRVVDWARRPAAAAYRQFEELEADAEGVNLAAAAGYDPGAGVAVFARLAARSGETGRAPARTPLGELGGSVSGMVGEYFRTHPASGERSDRLAAILEGRKRKFEGRKYYVGRTNLAARVARSSREDATEWRVF